MLVGRRLARRANGMKPDVHAGFGPEFPPFRQVQREIKLRGTPSNLIPGMNEYVAVFGIR